MATHTSLSKGMGRKKIKIKCTTANTSAIWQHTTDKLLIAAKQEPNKKAHFSTKHTEEFSRGKSGEWASRQRKKR